MKSIYGEPFLSNASSRFGVAKLAMVLVVVLVAYCCLSCRSNHAVLPSPSAQVAGPPEEFPVLPMDVWVSPSTLALNVSQTDLSLLSEGFPFELKRSYQGGTQDWGAMGFGWTHSFDYFLAMDLGAGLIEIIVPGGGIKTFKDDGSGDSFDGGLGEKLVRKDAQLIMTTSDTLTYVFSETDGLLTKIENLDGLSLNLAYAQGVLKNISGPFGQSLVFTWAENGLVETVVSSYGEQIDYSYDDLGRLSEVDRNGRRCAQYAYDAGGYLTRADMSGMKWTAETGVDGKVRRLTDPQGRTDQFESERTDEWLSTTHVSPSGLVTTTRVFLDGTKTEVFDSLGAKTTSELDPKTGRTLAIVNDRGDRTELAYDDLGRLIRTVDPVGRATIFKLYENTMFPEMVQFPDGNAIRYAYDAAMNVTQQDSLFGGTTSYEYDDMGRVTRTTAANGTIRNFEYGEGWFPLKITDGTGNDILTAQFDEHGRLSAVKAGALGEMSAIEVQDQLTDRIKRDMLETHAENANRPNPFGGGLGSIAFDATGNLIQVSHPDDSISDLVYDARGNVIELLENGKTTQTMTYDNQSNLVSTHYPDGTAVVNQFNRLNKIRKVDYSDGPDLEIVYDRFGRIGHAKRGRINKDFSYDEKARLASCTLALSKSVEDPSPLFSAVVGFETRGGFHGEPVSMNVHHSGHEVKFSYDAKRQLRLVTCDVGQFTFDTDELVLASSISYPNGVKQISELVTDGSQVLSVQNASGEIKKIQIWENDRGLTQRRVDSSHGEAVFGYDELGQLTSATLGDDEWRYTYDAWGNRKTLSKDGQSTEYSFSSGARLNLAGDVSYSWDVRGNLASKKTPEGETTYEFNTAGHLLNITGPDGKRVSFGYDADGLLVTRVAEGRSTTILYHGINPIAELDHAGREFRRYIYALAPDCILAMVETDPDSAGTSPEKVTYFHRDERNNVVLLTDDTGNEVATFSYDPFGNLIAKTGNVIPPFLFAGCRYEPLFDLYYMRHRFYDPQIGRFLSKDPLPGDLENVLSINPYLYVQNSPMNFVDPMGTTGLPSGWAYAKEWAAGFIPGMGDIEADMNNASVSYGGLLFEGYGKSLLKDADVLKTSSWACMREIGLDREAAGNFAKTWGPQAGNILTGVMATWEELGRRGQINTWDLTEKDDMTEEQKKRIRAKNRSLNYGNVASNTANSTLGNLVGTTFNILASAAGAVITSAKGAAAVGTGTAMLGVVIANWSSGRVKELVKVYGQARDAQHDALNDAKLALNKTMLTTKKARAKIDHLVKTGDFKKAKELRDRFKRYRDKTSGGDKDFDDYLVGYLDDKIKAAEDKKKADDKQRKFVKDMDQYNKDQAKKEEQKKKDQAAKDAYFIVEIKADETILNPGANLTGKIELTGGTPPFVFSGAYSGSETKRVIPFSFPVPKETGQFELVVTVVDKKKEERTAKLDVLIEEHMTMTLELNRDSVVAGNQLATTITIENGIPPYTLSGSADGVTSEPITVFQLDAPAEPGTYRVSIDVKDADGEKTSATQTYEVTARPKLSKNDFSKRVSQGTASTTINIKGLVATTFDGKDRNGNRRFEGVYFPGDEITVFGTFSLEGKKGGLSIEFAEFEPPMEKVPDLFTKTICRIKTENGPMTQDFSETFVIDKEFHGTFTVNLDEGERYAGMFADRDADITIAAPNFTYQLEPIAAEVNAVVADGLVEKIREKYEPISSGTLYVGEILDDEKPVGTIDLVIAGEKVFGSCAYEFSRKDYRDQMGTYYLNGFISGTYDPKSGTIKAQLEFVARCPDFDVSVERYTHVVKHLSVELVGKDSGGSSLFGGGKKGRQFSGDWDDDFEISYGKWIIRKTE